MKNVVKKLFSLLLIGVVAVSMFSFIVPNHVDAEVGTPRGIIVLILRNMALYYEGVASVNYSVKFYDVLDNAKEKLICSQSVSLSNDGVDRKPVLWHDLIPAKAKIVVIETGKWWECRKFKLDESSEFSTGLIEVTSINQERNKGMYIRSRSSGCWKQV